VKEPVPEGPFFLLEMTNKGLNGSPGPELGTGERRDSRGRGVNGINLLSGNP